MLTDGEPLLLAIDQGTSGTSATLYTLAGRLVASADVRVASYHPQPGWVEQDPNEILTSIRRAFHSVVEAAGLRPGQIASAGFAHQGESLLLWDLETGRPVHAVMSWQCIRSEGICATLIKRGAEADFRQRTSLPLVPEWPATKVAWAVANRPEVRELMRARRLAYSQIDAWLMRQLTGERAFRTDHSMAARSGFYNIQNLSWDETLIELFEAVGLALPEVVGSDGDFGEIDFGAGWRIPWRGNLIDQASALLGQACTSAGEAKITYGTCAAFWYNIGHSPITSQYMDTSIAWMIGGQPTYALVGETTTAGAAIEWLRDKLHLQADDAELSTLAKSAGDQPDLIFVPAFSGLGSPYGAPHVRGTVYGLTGGTDLNDLLRAGLNSIAFSVRDVMEALVKEGQPLGAEVKVDGGMTANEYLMQFQADVLGQRVLVPANVEGTALGVAFLAGLAGGLFPDVDFIRRWWKPGHLFEPRLPADERERRYARWTAAVAHTLAAYPQDQLKGCDAPQSHR